MPLTIAELTSGHLNVQGRDAFLGLLLASAVGFAEGETRRNLTADAIPTTRSFRLRSSVWVRIPDARTVTTVTLDATALTTADFDLHRARRGPTFVKLELLQTPASLFRVFPATCVVTGLFGMDPVPDDLRDAIYTLVARNYHERDAMYGDQVAASEGGGIFNYFRSVPPRVRATLDAYKVPTDQIGLG